MEESALDDAKLLLLLCESGGGRGSQAQSCSQAASCDWALVVLYSILTQKFGLPLVAVVATGPSCHGERCGAGHSRSTRCAVGRRERGLMAYCPEIARSVRPRSASMLGFTARSCVASISSARATSVITVDC